MRTLAIVLLMAAPVLADDWRITGGPSSDYDSYVRCYGLDGVTVVDLDTANDPDMTASSSSANHAAAGGNSKTFSPGSTGSSFFQELEMGATSTLWSTNGVAAVAEQDVNANGSRYMWANDDGTALGTISIEAAQSNDVPNDAYVRAEASITGGQGTASHWSEAYWDKGSGEWEVYGSNPTWDDTIDGYDALNISKNWSQSVDEDDKCTLYVESSIEGFDTDVTNGGIIVSSSDIEASATVAKNIY